MMKSKLAVHGGTPELDVVPRWPQFGKEEEEELLQVLHSGKWWRGGSLNEMQNESRTGVFEKAFSEFNGVRHTLAVSNGTVAIQLVLRALGIGAGDEVICPSVSFIATAAPVVLECAIPIFVDIDPETYQMDPEEIEKAIIPDTKAICLVHYGGYPADMDRIMEIARKHNLKVIEDSAHALGTEWKGQKAGTFGDAGTFSFQMSKALTCGEGGAVITNNSDLFDLLYSYHHIGRMESKGFYDFFLPAWNFRLSDLQGAVLLAQFRKFPDVYKRKQENGKYLAEKLNAIDGIRTLKPDPRITARGYYMFLLRYDKAKFNGVPRKRFLEALSAEGVPCWGGYGKPLHKTPIFQDMSWMKENEPFFTTIKERGIDYSTVSCPHAEHAIAEEQVIIKHDMLVGSRSDMDAVVRAVEKVAGHSKELL